MTDIVPPVSARRQDRPSDMRAATSSPQPVDNSPTRCGQCTAVVRLATAGLAASFLARTVMSFVRDCGARWRSLLARTGVASHLVALPSVDDLLAAAVGAVPGGVSRPGQQTMAAAVARATREKEHLLVQAGTGTGKSLAYLVPSLLVDGPVVVSTATLALQNQLVEHDLPRLADAAEPMLGRRPKFAVLKGRHHYVCLAKLDAGTEEEPDALFDAGSGQGGGGGTRWLGQASRLGKQIQRLRDWALETETGDRDELDPG